MKAILIDVRNRTVSEVEVVSNNGSQLQSIYEHLKCSTFACIYVEDSDDSIYVDGEGLLGLNDESKFFMFNEYPQPISGNGLILGINYDTGDSVDTHLTVEDVTNRVKFMNMQEVMLMVDRENRVH